MSETLELKELPKGHVSVSQVEMLRRCPKQYEFRYVKGMKMPPPFVLVKGSAGHETLHTYFRLKKESGIPMLQDEFTDCFRTELEGQILKAKDNYGEIDYTRKERKGKVWETVKEEPRRARDRIVDETVPSLQSYHQLELELLAPVETEKEFEIELSTGLKIIAKIDYSDDDKIVEYKFSSRKQKAERPTNQQLVYSITNPKLNARLDRILIKGENQILPFKTPNQEAVKELLREYEKMATLIKTGLFYRNPGFNSTNCGMCGFKSLCRRIL